MKIEAGKRYLTRNGYLVEIISITPMGKSNAGYPVRGRILKEKPVVLDWTITGNYLDKNIENPFDLIKEENVH